MCCFADVRDHCDIPKAVTGPRKRARVTGEAWISALAEGELSPKQSHLLMEEAGGGVVRWLRVGKATPSTGNSLSKDKRD